MRGVCAQAQTHRQPPCPPEENKQGWGPGPGGGTRCGLTATIWCCSSLQCLGRMGRMVGGSRTPSSMWITPLEASTSTLRSGTPSGPSRMRPCGGAQCSIGPARSPLGPLLPVLLQTSLQTVSSSLPRQCCPLRQNHSSLPALSHVERPPPPCAHPARLWSPPSLLGPRRGI